MWRSKKFILIAVVVALVLVGSIGGIALAQTESTDNTSGNSLLGRVAAILGIDQQTVEDAFDQARTEMRDERLDSYLKNLVDEGKITQEQADQYKTWWQSKPNMEQYREQLRNWEQTRPNIPQEYEDWQDAMPDLPGGFGGFGFRGHGMSPGMFGCR